jgi:hypothetical protein
VQGTDAAGKHHDLEGEKREGCFLLSHDGETRVIGMFRV